MVASRPSLSLCVPRLWDEVSHRESFRRAALLRASYADCREGRTTVVSSGSEGRSQGLGVPPPQRGGRSGPLTSPSSGPSGSPSFRFTPVSGVRIDVLTRPLSTTVSVGVHDGSRDVWGSGPGPSGTRLGWLGPSLRIPPSSIPGEVILRTDSVRLCLVGVRVRRSRLQSLSLSLRPIRLRETE